MMMVSSRGRAGYQSRKVNKLVCSTFSARSASRSSITQEMLISLAPVQYLLVGWSVSYGVVSEVWVPALEVGGLVVRGARLKLVVSGDW